MYMRFEKGKEICTIYCKFLDSDNAKCYAVIRQIIMRNKLRKGEICQNEKRE